MVAMIPYIVMLITIIINIMSSLYPALGAAVVLLTVEGKNTKNSKKQAIIIIIKKIYI